MSLLILQLHFFPINALVDASQAGEGTLELVVSTKKGSVRAEVSMRSRGVYNVTFLPTETTTHFVNITFNEEEVPGQFEHYTMVVD